MENDEMDFKLDFEDETNKHKGQYTYIQMHDLDSYFKFDHPYQDLSKNDKFQKWKSKMKNDYGQNVRLYKCNQDKIYFFKKKDEECDFYSEQCPKCQHQTCCFCSKSMRSTDRYYSRYLKEYCCFKRMFYYVFFRENFRDKGKIIYPIYYFILTYIIFLIPFLVQLGLTVSIMCSLYFVLESNVKNFQYNEFYTYNELILFRHRVLFIIFNIMTFIFSICMAICYMNFSLIYIPIIILFSIPFKTMPILNFVYFMYGNADDMFWFHLDDCIYCDCLI
jgi:hypothetical protein